MPTSERFESHANRRARRALRLLQGRLVQALYLEQITGFLTRQIKRRRDRQVTTSEPSEPVKVGDRYVYSREYLRELERRR